MRERERVIVLQNASVEKRLGNVSAKHANIYEKKKELCMAMHKILNVNCLERQPPKERNKGKTE